MEGEEAKSRIKKEGLPMNILVCGSKIERLYIESLFNDEIKKNSKNIRNIYDEYNFFYGWKFQIFKDGLKKYNLDLVFNNIKENYINKNNRDLIVCFIEDSFENAKEVIKYFNQKPVIFQTFILLITTNKEITKQKIKKYIFIDELVINIDSRNVEILQYNDRDIFAFFQILFKKSCYFNEKGDELSMPSINDSIHENIKGKHNFNFLVIGNPGTGKSTFINIMNGEKVAKEALGGEKVTYEICQYHAKETNLILYDTPGFGLSNELEKVNNYYIKEIRKKKKKFHCIIFLLSHHEERFFDYSEECLIKELLKLQVPFYFILNKSKLQKKNTKKKKKIKDKLKDILEEEINNKFIIDNKFNYPKVICLNLRSNEDSFCFGLDKLFDDLYKFYEPYKININSLDLNKTNPKKIAEIIKYNIFFEGLNSKEEILENLIRKCKLEISRFSALSDAVGFITNKWSDTPILLDIQVSMVIDIAYQFGITMEKNEAKDIVINLSKSSVLTAGIAATGKIVGSVIKFFAGIGSVAGGTFCESTDSVGTFNLGMSTISFFKPKFGNSELFNFIRNRAIAFNSNVELFKSYSEKFKVDEDEEDDEKEYIYTLA